MKLLCYFANHSRLIQRSINGLATPGEPKTRLHRCSIDQIEHVAHRQPSAGFPNTGGQGNLKPRHAKNGCLRDAYRKSSCVFSMRDFRRARLRSGEPHLHQVKWGSSHERARQKELAGSVFLFRHCPKRCSRVPHPGQHSHSRIARHRSPRPYQNDQNTASQRGQPHASRL